MAVGVFWSVWLWVVVGNVILSVTVTVVWSVGVTGFGLWVLLWFGLWV